MERSERVDPNFRPSWIQRLNHLIMSNSFSILALVTFWKALPRYWQDWPLIAFDFFNLTVSIKSNGKRVPLL